MTMTLPFTQSLPTHPYTHTTLTQTHPTLYLTLDMALSHYWVLVGE